MSMNTPLNELVCAYLDGDLDGDESRRFEEQLHERAIAGALAEELALRDWLQQVGPEAPPEELTRQLELAVTARAPEAHDPDAGAPTRFVGLRAALAGMSWMARGPALAVTTQAAPVYGAVQGLGTLGYAVAPLTAGRAPRKKEHVSKKRRAASLAWKLMRRV